APGVIARGVWVKARPTRPRSEALQSSRTRSGQRGKAMRCGYCARYISLPVTKRGLGGRSPSAAAANGTTRLRLVPAFHPAPDLITVERSICRPIPGGECIDADAPHDRCRL